MKEGTYYAANRERRLQEAKEYREKNKEYYNAYYRTWYLKNKDELYARRKANYRRKPVKKQADPPTESPVISPVNLPVFPEPEIVSNIEYVSHPIVVSFD